MRNKEQQLLLKNSQRGRSPLPTLNVEKQSLIENNLGPFLEESPKNHPEIDFQISGRFDEISKLHKS